MKFLMNPNSRLFGFLSRVMDLFLLNLLFILTSLPIITIGPSLLALNNVTMHLAMEESMSVAEDYLKSFKKDFKRGLQLSGLVVFFLCSFLICFFALTQLKGINIVIGTVGILVLTIILAVLGTFLFPYTARYEDGFFHSIKVCFQMAALNLKETILTLGIPIAVFMLFTLSNYLFVLGTLILLFLGFAGLAYFNCSQLFPVFQKYE